MFDEALLGDEKELLRRDRHRLLWSLATAGAQVRRALETADEFGVDRLAGERPRALVVATDAAAPGVMQLVTRISCDATPALPWHEAELPRWAGASDALLIASIDGQHPRLAELAEQGARRGLAMAVVAPKQSPVGVAAGRAPLAALPPDLNPRACRWAVLTPLLQALNSLGLHSVPTSVLEDVARALDESAEGARPSGDPFTNAAKSLAVELAEALPLVAGAGSVATVAARAVAEALQVAAGAPAVAVSLPDGVQQAAAMLRAGAVADPQDIFRDRVDEQDSGRRPRLLVIGDDGAVDDPDLGPRSPAQIQLDEVGARRAAAALHRLAGAVGLRSSSVDVPGGDPLVRFAAATAFGDFTASYLALGLGIDPGAPDPAEHP
jgi:hypothetical protein